MNTKLLAVLITLSAFTACNNTATTIITNADSTVVITDTVSSKHSVDSATIVSAVNDAIEEVTTEITDFYTASGSEPGWYINLKQSSNGDYPVEVQLNYGKEIWKGTLSRKMETGGNKINLLGKLNFNDKKQDFSVIITKEKCIQSASGDNGNASVIVKTNGVSYKACGNTVK
ncbi:MAG: hypothetical protein H7331_05195 [Bacteroidia bacterium]|nr:hypothetical protein [Bacteroidia bacterium]